MKLRNMKTPDPKPSHFMNTYDASTHKIKVEWSWKNKSKVLELAQVHNQMAKLKQNQQCGCAKIEKLDNEGLGNCNVFATWLYAQW